MLCAQARQFPFSPCFLRLSSLQAHLCCEGLNEVLATLDRHTLDPQVQSKGLVLLGSMMQVGACVCVPCIVSFSRLEIQRCCVSVWMGGGVQFRALGREMEALLPVKRTLRH